MAVPTTLDLEHLSATICAELAAGLADAAGIRQKYSITVAQWNQLKQSTVFRAMLAEAIREWQGDLNAGKRITKKAEIMLEDSLPVLYDMAHDKDAPRAQRLEAIKHMGTFAGRTNSKGEPGAAQLGGQRGATINITVVTHQREEQRLIIDVPPTSSLLPSPSDLAPEDASG